MKLLAYFALTLILLACTSIGGFRGSELSIVEEVNRRVNRDIRYSDDMSLYGVREYWATPTETLKAKAGDCDDYAILKYYTLKPYIKEGELWYAFGSFKGITHLFLLYYDKDGVAYALDNAVKTLHPLSERPDLEVLMKFTEDYVWFTDTKYPSTTRSPAYEDMLLRYKGNIDETNDGL